MSVISWNTHKTETGNYRWEVYSFEYQTPQQVLKAGECPTRARAVTKAKAWLRFFKATQAPREG